MITEARGFTLLEVLIATSILGLGLTAILSSQVGLFSGAEYASQLSIATGLARCRMNEIEVELLRDGYPLLDQDDEGPCCADEYQEGFKCTWKIEKVELPAAGNLSGSTDGEGSAGASSGDSPLSGALGALASGSFGAGGGGGFEQLAQGLSSLSENPEATLGANPNLSNLASFVGGVGATSGLANFAMSLVYPDLKLMLEASIRKITLSVLWQDGSVQRELVLEQFTAFPQQGGFDPLAAEGLNDALQTAGAQLGLGQGLGGGSAGVAP